MTQVWTAKCEQGYEWRQFGTTPRFFLDHGGLGLVVNLRKPPKKKKDDVAESST